MVERTPILNFFTHLILFVGFVFCVAPFVVVAVAASHNLRDVNDVPMSLLPGSDFWVNIKTAWTTADLGPKLLNSLIMATGVAAGKVIISALTAFFDPGVQFGLQFRGETEAKASPAPVVVPAPLPEEKAQADGPDPVVAPEKPQAGEVVSLDSFRKK